MELERIRQLPLSEVRKIFKDYLHQQMLSINTINTSSTDAFYIWRNGTHDLFWDVVTDDDFEKNARLVLHKILTENSAGNVNSLVSAYLSHLRKFRNFIYSSSKVTITALKIVERSSALSKRDIIVPTPLVKQVEWYLRRWDTLENYHLQENALNKLFHTLCPNNVDISDILLKAATLNDFYSTNIFSIYPVANHILSLDIDERLKVGDSTLVSEIQTVKIGSRVINFYSFATKYCSHHNYNTDEYPIYDSYVDALLRYFRKRDGFSNFSNNELKDYCSFKKILNDFRRFYGLEQYSLKEIDKYIWQLGKEFFPKHY